MLAAVNACEDQAYRHSISKQRSGGDIEVLRRDGLRDYTAAGTAYQILRSLFDDWG